MTEYIARPDAKSVRELEGALNRVMAYATLQQAPLTVGLAVQAREHIYSGSKPISDLTAVEVLEGVCRYYNIDPALVRGEQSDRDIVWPRQVAMYLMREETSASLLQIGTELGGRQHTTIVHGREKVQNEIRRAATAFATKSPPCLSPSNNNRDTTGARSHSAGNGSRACCIIEQEKASISTIEE